MRIIIRRTLGAVLTVGLTVAAVRFGMQSRDYACRFDEWVAAVPTDFAVDFSTVGEVEVEFVQTCDRAHGETISLRVAGEPRDLRAALRGFRGLLEIVDSRGESVVTAKLSGDRLDAQAEPSNVIQLVYFSPFKTGDYRIRLSVESPAPALAGVSQRLTARYELCGLELMPAHVLGGIAGLAGLLALILGSCTGLGVYRHGWRIGNA